MWRGGVGRKGKTENLFGIIIIFISLKIIKISVNSQQSLSDSNNVKSCTYFLEQSKRKIHILLVFERRKFPNFFPVKEKSKNIQHNFHGWTRKFSSFFSVATSRTSETFCGVEGSSVGKIRHTLVAHVIALLRIILDIDFLRLLWLLFLRFWLSLPFFYTFLQPLTPIYKTRKCLNFSIEFPFSHFSFTSHIGKTETRTLNSRQRSWKSVKKLL